MECYAISAETTISDWDYGELSSRHSYQETERLADYYKLAGLLLKDGVLVGIVCESYEWQRKIRLLPNKSAWVYSETDDDGTGSRDRDERAALICKNETALISGIPTAMW